MILLLKSHVAGHQRHLSSGAIVFVQPHEDRRVRPSRRDNRPSFEDDMHAQAQWLDERAREHGFDDVEHLLTDDPGLFARLAEGWRAEHPAMAKAIEQLGKAHPATQGATRSLAAGAQDLEGMGAVHEPALPMLVRRNPGEPSRKQAEAGRYNKPRVEWQGLTIAIENPAGSMRRGTNRDGVSWEVRMLYDYGEVVGSMGVDGDPVDIYLGPNPDAPLVYVVHQRKVNRWDEYDEDKVMAGFDSEEDAKAAFLSCYNDPRFLGPVTAMPVAEFVAKVRATRERPAMIKSVFFLKTHVDAYTKKDGTFVAAHEDRRRAAADVATHITWGAKEVVEQIRSAMDDDEFAAWGLRVIPSGHEVGPGDELPASYRWDDGDKTEEELDGTSTIGIRANGGIEGAIRRLKNNNYLGDQVALVFGDSAGAGEDPGEVLIRDAKVALVWRRP